MMSAVLVFYCVFFFIIIFSFLVFLLSHKLSELKITQIEYLIVNRLEDPHGSPWAKINVSAGFISFWRF